MFPLDRFDRASPTESGATIAAPLFLETDPASNAAPARPGRRAATARASLPMSARPFRSAQQQSAAPAAHP